MKGREIYDELKGKVDPALLKVLVSLGEGLSVNKQQVMECAALVDQCTKAINTFARALSGYNKAFAELVPKGSAKDARDRIRGKDAVVETLKDDES